MYNRECVSYTAFKVAVSGRHMPYWGGYGNANQWDDNARASGIAVDGNPREGDVAQTDNGYYGHVMYVEYVYGDGTILISQYNVNLDGRYSEKRISAAGLNFIHF
jgi:surface antigen